MREDLPARLRAGAEILLQCPEHVRLKRDHAPMGANLYRRADEANEAADEIEWLRLTDAEREAVKWALGEAVWSYNPDCGDHADTLRRLLTRMTL